MSSGVPSSPSGAWKFRTPPCFRRTYVVSVPPGVCCTEGHCDKIDVKVSWGIFMLYFKCRQSLMTVSKFVLLQFGTTVARSTAASLVHADKTFPGKKNPRSIAFSFLVCLPCQIFLDEGVTRDR